jgi:hypothetical protein
VTSAARKLALSLLCLVTLHELALWGLCESQLPSMLFAPGPHSAVVAAAVAVAFIGLRWASTSWRRG